MTVIVSSLSSAGTSGLDSRALKCFWITCFGYPFFFNALKIYLTSSDFLLGVDDNRSALVHNATISGNQYFPTPNPTYHTSAIEADMRIWRYVYIRTYDTPAGTILVYSPEMDVYIIDIAVANAFPLKKLLYK